MSAMTSSIWQMTEAIERKSKIKATKAKLNERVDASILHYLRLWKKLKGYVKISTANAFENFLHDEVKVKIFITYSNEIRIRFLESHFEIYANNNNFNFYMQAIAIAIFNVYFKIYLSTYKRNKSILSIKKVYACNIFFSKKFMHLIFIFLNSPYVIFN